MPDSSAGCRHFLHAAGVAVVLLVVACAGSGDAWRYPAAPRGPQVDRYHGVDVRDPYRWLEDLGAPETQAWIEAENALALPYLEGLPGRAHFARRLAQLLDYEHFDIPRQRGGRYFYFHNSGSQEQDSVWFTQDIGVQGTLLIDPQRLSDDGTVSVGDLVPDPDGRLLAYSLSDGGTDWRSWRVLDVERQADLGQELRGIKFSSVSWSADGRGFYYSRYPLRQDGDGFDDQQQVSVWYHAIGTAQAEDELVFQVTDHPARNPYARTTDDDAYLVIDLFDGYSANGIYYQRLQDGRPVGSVVRLLDGWDARYEFLGNQGDRFFFSTVRDAPRGRIIAIDLEHPQPQHWHSVVAEAGEAIRAATLVGGVLIVQYMVDAHAVVRVFDVDGNRRGDVALPGKGSVAGFAGRTDDTETFFSYTDFTTPLTVYRYVVATGAMAPVRRPEVAIDPAGYVTRQVFVTSADGTRVPIFIVHRADMKFDTPQPTVLYGYGGFNISVLPTYSSMRMAWLEAGGVYVSANLRGGGEFGEAWHLAGTRLEKQNVFDDFIAAAQWLIDSGITDRRHLAIWGISNGGLLAAAAVTQRPELFAAVIPSVGVLDMLRYQTASANARQWSTDYGLSENAAEFAAQFAYSPVHRVREGACYPPTLVIADTSDDRVLPWHSYKFAAALQHAQGCDQPILTRIETRSGHGAGRSLSKNIAQYADQWAFVAEHTGLKVDPDMAGN